MKSDQRIVIAGGGVLGLGLAYFLSKKGYSNITLIEKSDQLGGAITWSQVDRFTIDRFYHGLLSEDGRVFRLLDELGLEGQYGFSTTHMGIFHEGKMRSIASALDFLNYPLPLWDKFRLAYTVCYCMYKEGWNDIEHLSASEWLEKIGGKSNYQKLWRPIMRAKFGALTDDLTAVDMYSRIKRMAGSRKSNSSQQVGYVKGTLKVLVEAFEQILVKQGVRIIKGTGIEELVIEEEKILQVRLENGESLDVDQFISSLPLPAIARLIPEKFQDYKKKLEKVRYMDNVSLILVLKKELTPFYMLNIQDPESPFTGVIGTSQIYSSDHFEGHKVYYISKYLTKDDEAFYQKTKDEVLDLYEPYLKQINPEFDRSWIEASSLSKGRQAEPFHAVNYSKSIPDQKMPFANGYLLSNAQIYPEITVIDTSIKMSEAFAQSFESASDHSAEEGISVPAGSSAS